MEKLAIQYVGISLPESFLDILFLSESSHPKYQMFSTVMYFLNLELSVLTSYTRLSSKYYIIVAYCKSYKILRFQTLITNDSLLLLCFTKMS